MFKIIHGSISPNKLSAYCVVYNEMFYLPAFLDHYRSLGIEQFIFIDDGSTDESFAYLASQPDTVIAQPEMRYGDKLNGKRAGPQWKSIFAQRYLQGRWSLCVDADEFLVFGLPSLHDVIEKAESRGDLGLGAVMVDMYPAQLAALDGTEAPNSFSSMLQSYPFFDRGPYLDWQVGLLKPRVIYEGAFGRLLKEHAIRTSDYSSRLTRFLERIRPAKARSVFKVPLVRWGAGLQYLNAHTLNHAPTTCDGLALLHFKFTSALREKMNWAIERKSFNKGSRGYFALQAVLFNASSRRNEFTYEGTCRYGSYQDLEAAEIIPLKRK